MSEPASISTAISAPISVDDALDNLVDQFANPLSFYRELIQNALDAGSPGVDILLEFEEPKRPGAPGVAVIHVDDFGEGMDRAIIDSRLTRLFSSAKDGDFTKIGRFGIGFVSVFAIQPDAVCLDTSRGGEHWRVLFDRERTFTRIARDEPVDGTKIRIIKAMDRAAFDDLVTRSEQTVRYWCKHVAGEIRFQDAPINEALTVEGVCAVRHSEPGTEVVAAFGPAFFGFYNKGLTLLEGRDAFYPHAAFKVSSRYLEHTLTRDNVLRDDNFHKAMAIVADLVDRQLPKALGDAIAAEVRAGRGHAATAAQLYELAKAHLDEDGPTGEAIIARTVDGEDVSLARCSALKEGGRLLWDVAASEVTTAVAARERVLVLQAPDQSAPLLSFTTSLDGPAVTQVGERWCLPPRVEGSTRPNWAALETATEQLLDALGVRTAGLHLASFDYPGSSIAQRVAIATKDPLALTPVASIRKLGGRGFIGRKRYLLVNVDHPTVEQLLALAPHEPELAAYVLVKSFHLGGELDSALDGRFGAAALALRQAREATDAEAKRPRSTRPR